METAALIHDIRRQLDKIERKLVKRPTVWDKRNAGLRQAAEVTWRFLFNEPLPADISVKWVPYLRSNQGQATVGAIHCGGQVQLDWSYLRKVESPLATLVHEFSHCRGFERHNKRFHTHVNRWLKQLGLPEEESL